MPFRKRINMVIKAARGGVKSVLHEELSGQEKFTSLEKTIDTSTMMRQSQSRQTGILDCLTSRGKM